MLQKADNNSCPVYSLPAGSVESFRSLYTSGNLLIPSVTKQMLLDNLRFVFWPWQINIWPTCYLLILCTVGSFDFSIFWSAWCDNRMMTIGIQQAFLGFCAICLFDLIISVWLMGYWWNFFYMSLVCFYFLYVSTREIKTGGWIGNVQKAQAWIKGSISKEKCKNFDRRYLLLEVLSTR